MSRPVRHRGFFVGWLAVVGAAGLTSLSAIPAQEKDDGVVLLERVDTSKVDLTPKQQRILANIAKYKGRVDGKKDPEGKQLQVVRVREEAMSALKGPLVVQVTADKVVRIPNVSAKKSLISPKAMLVQSSKERP